MENIVWDIIFIMEVMKYILGEKIFFKRDVKRKWAGCVGLLIYLCIISFAQSASEEEQHLIMYGLTVATAYVMIYQKKIEDFVHILILFIEITCIEGITEKMVAFIGRDAGFLDLSDEYQFLITGIVVLFILFAVYFWSKKKRISEIKIRIEYIWVFVLCMVINLLLTASGLYLASKYVTNQRLQFILTIINIGSYLSVGLVVLFISYIKNMNQRLQQLLMAEKQLKEAQKEYYSSLLQREEETRKNRHDWNNHLICLAELAQKESANNTKRYIDTLMNQNARLKEKQYDVGNDVLNAILCCHLSELDDDIAVNIVGKCKNDIKMDAVDLCVIVSNLVQNAVEYLRGSNIESKELSFSIEEGNVYTRISVVNSVDHNVSERNFVAPLSA